MIDDHFTLVSAWSDPESPSLTRVRFDNERSYPFTFYAEGLPLYEKDVGKRYHIVIVDDNGTTKEVNSP